jgi:hypothetical protein
MTSNHRRMLQGLLSVAVVLSAAAVRAQNLEAPGAAASAPAAPPSSGPSGWGDSGQMVASAENMFGFNYNHPGGNNAHATTFALFSDGFAGAGDNTYQWPRLAFDAFVTKGISAGGAISYSRTTFSNANPPIRSGNAFQIAPRIGYAQMVGPWLGVWPRAGVTYIYSASTQKFLALTIDALAAVIVSPHLAVTFGPTLDLGLSGTPVTIWTVGVFFGLAITI